jgi:hypothetical protein
VAVALWLYVSLSFLFSPSNVVSKKAKREFFDRKKYQINLYGFEKKREKLYEAGKLGWIVDVKNLWKNRKISSKIFQYYFLYFIEKVM